MNGPIILSSLLLAGSNAVESSSRWTIAEIDQTAVEAIGRALGLHEAVARALVNRGVDSADSARRFLDPSIEHLHDPYLFVEMKQAVSRIARAVREQQRIVVYGDYDVDGITATAVLVKFLSRLGGRVRAYIPNRLEEGYGLNKDALAAIAEQGCDLVITADCGISAREEVAFGRSLGMDFVITDHHEPPDELPDAVAILNPKVDGSGYPFRDLAGVGVALKTVEAVIRAASRRQDPLVYLPGYLDLAALGTIADVAPLVDENRVIARCGIEEIRRGRNQGLSEVCRIAGIDQASIGVREVTFGLAPRLNAAGRMGDSQLALELLLSSDRRVAAWKAQQVDSMNCDRRSIQQEILDDILSSLPPPERLSDSIIVTAGEDWHPGVVGLVASKLAEMYYRPALVLSREGEYARGSARSVPEFDIHWALEECRELLCEFGGHQQAAGLTLQWDRIPQLTDKLKTIAREALGVIRPERCIFIDGILHCSDLDMELAEQLKSLEPFGEANPPPLFLMRDLAILEYRTVGTGGRHLKLVLGRMEAPVEAIAFGFGDLADQIRSERVESVDVVGEVSMNEWNGRQHLQMILCDIASAGSKDIEPAGATAAE